MFVKLQHILIPQEGKLLYKRHELFELKVREGYIHQISNSLQLTYQEKVMDAVNLCFVNSIEIRSEYKSIFTTTCILNYVVAVIKTDIINIETEEVAFPADSNNFWELVEQGKKLKINTTIKI